MVEYGLANFFTGTSNGATPGITLPSVSGQASVIRKAYAAANLPTDDTLYVEVFHSRKTYFFALVTIYL